MFAQLDISVFVLSDILRTTKGNFRSVAFLSPVFLSPSQLRTACMDRPDQKIFNQIIHQFTQTFLAGKYLKCGESRMKQNLHN